MHLVIFFITELCNRVSIFTPNRLIFNKNFYEFFFKYLLQHSKRNEKIKKHMNCFDENLRQVNEF